MVSARRGMCGDRLVVLFALISKLNIISFGSEFYLIVTIGRNLYDLLMSNG
jgi:hypothetical protein